MTRRLVAEKMGGAIERGKVANFSWELPLNQVRYELKSNVIPLGRVKAGIHIHRALLFKVRLELASSKSSLGVPDYFMCPNNCELN